MAAMGIGRLRRIFAGTTPTQRPSSSARRRQGRPNKCSVWPDAIGFFLTGCQGRFCRALRCVQEFSAAHRRRSGWSGALTTSLPCPHFPFSASTQTRQGNHGEATPAWKTARRRGLKRCPAKVGRDGSRRLDCQPGCLEQNVSPFEPLPPVFPSHSQQVVLDFCPDS